MGATKPRDLVGPGATTTTITIPAGSDFTALDWCEDTPSGRAPAPLGVEECRDAWCRALERGRVDVRHIDDVPQAERDRLTALGLSTACWPWTWAVNSKGYGTVRVAGLTRLAHRTSWVAHHGRDVPAGYHLDHLCRNRTCVNPTHLDPVTNAENIRRGESPNAITHRTGVCARGHQITWANMVTAPSATTNGKGGCRACKNATRAAHGRRSAGWDPDPTEAAAFIQAYSDALAAEYLALDAVNEDTDGVAQLALITPPTARSLAPGEPIHACAGVGICRTVGCRAAAS